MPASPPAPAAGYPPFSYPPPPPAVPLGMPASPPGPSYPPAQSISLPPLPPLAPPGGNISVAPAPPVPPVPPPPSPLEVTAVVELTLVNGHAIDDDEEATVVEEAAQLMGVDPARVAYATSDDGTPLLLIREASETEALTGAVSAQDAANSLVGQQAEFNTALQDVVIVATLAVQPLPPPPPATPPPPEVPPPLQPPTDPRSDSLGGGGSESWISASFSGGPKYFWLAVGIAIVVLLLVCVPLACCWWERHQQHKAPSATATEYMAHVAAAQQDRQQQQGGSGGGSNKSSRGGMRKISVQAKRGSATSSARGAGLFDSLGNRLDAKSTRTASGALDEPSFFACSEQGFGINHRSSADPMSSSTQSNAPSRRTSRWRRTSTDGPSSGSGGGQRSTQPSRTSAEPSIPSSVPPLNLRKTSVDSPPRPGVGTMI